MKNIEVEHRNPLFSVLAGMLVVLLCHSKTCPEVPFTCDPGV